MKKIILLVIILTSIFLLFGCDGPLIKDPETLSFSYGNGATHLEWGSYAISVNEAGEGTYLATQGMAMQIKENFNLTKEEMLEVYYLAAQNHFQSLNDSYKDPSIMDGGWERLSFTINGETKTVQLVNYSLPQIDNISSKIVSLANEKLGHGLFGINFMDYCPKMKSDCYGITEENCKMLDSSEQGFEECYGCLEWSELCEWDSVDSFVASVESCDPLENREECIDYCSDTVCEEDLCDALMFDAPECTQCGPGCCSFCNDLDSCYTHVGCEVTWVHPSGESWQYGGCQNMNLCESISNLCDYLFNSYQGYAYHSAIEEDQEKSEEYSLVSDTLLGLYTEECE